MANRQRQSIWILFIEVQVQPRNRRSQASIINFKLRKGARDVAAVIILADKIGPAKNRDVPAVVRTQRLGLELGSFCQAARKLLRLAMTKHMGEAAQSAAHGPTLEPDGRPPSLLRCVIHLGKTTRVPCMLGTCLVQMMEYRPGLLAVKVIRVISPRFTEKESTMPGIVAGCTSPFTPTISSVTVSPCCTTIVPGDHW